MVATSFLIISHLVCFRRTTLIGKLLKTSQSLHGRSFLIIGYAYSLLGRDIRIRIRDSNARHSEDSFSKTFKLECEGSAMQQRVLPRQQLLINP